MALDGESFSYSQSRLPAPGAEIGVSGAGKGPKASSPLITGVARQATHTMSQLMAHSGNEAVSGKTLSGKSSGPISSYVKDRSFGTDQERGVRNKKSLAHMTGTWKPPGSKSSQEALNALYPWNAESVRFPSRSGSQLEGVVFQSTSERERNKETDQTILLCSGSHQSFEHQTLPMVYELTKMGHDVMVFNYSGFGASEGEPSEEACYQDARGALDYLQQQGKDLSHIKVLGYSMGGPIALKLAEKHPVDVFVDRGMTSAPDVGQSQFAFPPAKAIAKAITKSVHQLDGVKALGSAKGRVAWAVGDSDRQIPDRSDKIQDRGEGVQAQKVPSEHEHDPRGFGIVSIELDGEKLALEELIADPNVPEAPKKKAEIQLDKIESRRAEKREELARAEGKQLWYTSDLVDQDGKATQHQAWNRALDSWFRGGEFAIEPQ